VYFYGTDFAMLLFVFLNNALEFDEGPRSLANCNEMTTKVFIFTNPSGGCVLHFPCFKQNIISQLTPTLFFILSSVKFRFSSFSLLNIITIKTAKCQLSAKKQNIIAEISVIKNSYKFFTICVHRT